MYEIAWKLKARKQLKKIGDQQDRETIYGTVSELNNWPACRNIKPLSNHKYGYRLRIGRYRIFFDVQTGDVRVIEIQEVKKRDERTY